MNGGAGGFDGEMSRSRGFGFGGGSGMGGGMGGAMGAGAAGGRASRPGWKSGDWICTRCVLLKHYLFLSLFFLDTFTWLKTSYIFIGINNN